MNVLNAEKVEVKPTSYAMIINSQDGDSDLLSFRLKVTRQTLGRFISTLPLLIPSARKSFPRLSFWLDVPVDICRMDPHNSMELSAKCVHFKVTDNEMICFVPGYDTAISMSVETFVSMVNDLHAAIEGGLITHVEGKLSNSIATHKHSVFRSIGVIVKCSFAPYIMATYDADVCVISNYIPKNEGRVLERFKHIKCISYFKYSEDKGWEMITGMPFLCQDFIKATNAFRTY